MSGVAVAVAVAHGPGFYGKLPSRGDFVSRRLPQPFVAPWDAWLQQGLAASQATLGERWLDVYLTSPIWRFVLASRVCGEAAYCGVLVPSVDRVGRYFPLTVAVALPAGIPPGAAFGLEHWYAAVEELLLATLSDDAFDLDAFDARLADLAWPGASIAPAAAAGFAATSATASTLAAVGAERRHYTLPAAAEARAALLLPFSAVLDGLMSYSVWWTQGSERVAPCALFASGLPEQQAFVAMLDGAFQTHGWISEVHAEPRASTAAGISSVRSAAVTDVGKTRNVNEDAYASRDDLGVFIVADGLGGHQAGDVASGMVASVIDGLEGAASLRERVELLVRALRVVNGCLLAYAETTHAAGIAGSTVAALLLDGSKAACVWAGDSRIYRWRDGELAPLTRDHSDAPDAPGNRAVTRAVGGTRALELEVEFHDVLPGDRYLLCSDGLYGEADAAALAAALAFTDPADACRQLKSAALGGDAKDNLTAVVVHVGGPAKALA